MCKGGHVVAININRITLHDMCLFLNSLLVRDHRGSAVVWFVVLFEKSIEMAACVCAPNIRQLADKKSTLNKKLDQFPLALLLYSFHTTKRASAQ